MTRYAFTKQPKGVWDVIKHQDGPWLLFADHEVEIERLQAERDEFRSLNELHKEQFLKVNLELATAKREVIWTTQRPTGSGWYWMKDGSAMAVVQIEIGTFDGFYIEWVWQAGSRMQTPLSCCKDMQWAGPIHEPKELA